MLQDAKFIGPMNILVGLLLIAISVPLILERIPMNHWYGVRIPKAFKSRDNWYAINRVGGKWLMGAGAVMLLAGLVAAIRPPVGHDAVVVVALIPALAVVLALIPILLYARRLR
jgi:uncharacterized membrane protein